MYREGTVLNALWCPEWQGSPKGRDLCICVADSFCSTVETSATL